MRLCWLEKIRQAKAELEAEARAAAAAQSKARAEAQDRRKARRQQDDRHDAGAAEGGARGKPQRTFIDPESRILKTKDGLHPGLQRAQGGAPASAAKVVEASLKIDPVCL